MMVLGTYNPATLLYMDPLGKFARPMSVSNPNRPEHARHAQSNKPQKAFRPRPQPRALNSDCGGDARGCRFLLKSSCSLERHQPEVGCPHHRPATATFLHYFTSVSRVAEALRFNFG